MSTTDGVRQRRQTGVGEELQAGSPPPSPKAQDKGADKVHDAAGKRFNCAQMGATLQALGGKLAEGMTDNRLTNSRPAQYLASTRVVQGAANHKGKVMTVLVTLGAVFEGLRRAGCMPTGISSNQLSTAATCSWDAAMASPGAAGELLGSAWTGLRGMTGF